MSALSRSVYVLTVVDALIITLVTMFTFISFVGSIAQFLFIVLWFFPCFSHW